MLFYFVTFEHSTVLPDVHGVHVQAPPHQLLAVKTINGLEAAICIYRPAGDVAQVDE
jgi:hypothetical protein